MRRRLTVLVLAATAGLAAVPVPAQAASWVAATCGAALTTNSYLRADLTCAGPGLSFDVRGQSGYRTKSMVLDLRGHTLRAGPGSAGTAVTVAGPSTVSVTNGTIEGWDLGVRTVVGDPGEGLDVKKLTLDRLTLRANGKALESSAFPFTTSPTPVLVDRSLFVGNGRGVVTEDGGPVSVDRSTFRENESAFWADSAALSVSRSRLEDNATVAQCAESSCTFTDNTFHTNGRAILAGVFTEATVTGNVFSENSTGYEQTSFATGRLSRNQFSGNETGVHMTDSTAVLEDNTFVKNGSAFVLQDVGFVDPVTTLSRNFFVQNRDGVYAPDGGATLTANTAANNTGWGIYAPGSTDGGGNVAYGNGESAQCVGVACAAPPVPCRSADTLVKIFACIRR